VIGEFTAAHPEALLTNALTSLLLVHTQVEVEAQLKLNSLSHVNCVGAPPLSVLESKEIATCAPSSEKLADISTGAGNGETDDSTVIVLTLFR
jgi:hypothetical protein